MADDTQVLSPWNSVAELWKQKCKLLIGKHTSTPKTSGVGFVDVS